MAKETAVFAGVVGWKGDTIVIMAGAAMGFSLLLLHVEKGLVVVVMGQLGRGLFWGPQ